MNETESLELLARIAENQERIIALLETNQARTERAIFRAAYTDNLASDVRRMRAFLAKDRLSGAERRELDRLSKQD